MSGALDVDQPCEIRLSVPASATYAAVVGVTVAGLASRLGFSDDEIEDLRTAVGELCTLLLTGPGRVTFGCRLRDTTLTLHARCVPERALAADAELTGRMIGAAVDQADLDLDRSRIRIVKRHRP